MQSRDPAPALAYWPLPWAPRSAPRGHWLVSEICKYTKRRHWLGFWKRLLDAPVIGYALFFYANQSSEQLIGLKVSVRRRIEPRAANPRVTPRARGAGKRIPKYNRDPLTVNNKETEGKCKEKSFNARTLTGFIKSGPRFS